MGNIFFNIDYTSLTALMVKIGVFAAITAMLLWLIYLTLVKTLFKKSKYDRTITLRLAFLWAVFFCFIIFNAYIFVLFYRYGIDSFLWTSHRFYLGILAQLVVYVGLVMLFYIKRYLYKKNISINALN